MQNRISGTVSESKRFSWAKFLARKPLYWPISPTKGNGSNDAALEIVQNAMPDSKRRKATRTRSTTERLAHVHVKTVDDEDTIHLPAIEPAAELQQIDLARTSTRNKKLSLSRRSQSADRTTKTASHESQGQICKRQMQNRSRKTNP